MVTIKWIHAAVVHVHTKFSGSVRHLAIEACLPMKSSMLNNMQIDLFIHHSRWQLCNGVDSTHSYILQGLEIWPNKLASHLIFSGTDHLIAPYGN
jgi:hypothetical protein